MAEAAAVSAAAVYWLQVETVALRYLRLLVTARLVDTSSFRYSQLFGMCCIIYLLLSRCPPSAIAGLIPTAFSRLLEYSTSIVTS